MNWTISVIAVVALVGVLAIVYLLGEIYSVLRDCLHLFREFRSEWHHADGRADNLRIQTHDPEASVRPMFGWGEHAMALDLTHCLECAKTREVIEDGDVLCDAIQHDPPPLVARELQPPELRLMQLDALRSHTLSGKGGYCINCGLSRTEIEEDLVEVCDRNRERAAQRRQRARAFFARNYPETAAESSQRMGVELDTNPPQRFTSGTHRISSDDTECLDCGAAVVEIRSAELVGKPLKCRARTIQGGHTLNGAGEHCVDCMTTVAEIDSSDGRLECRMPP